MATLKSFDVSPRELNERLTGADRDLLNGIYQRVALTSVGGGLATGLLALRVSRSPVLGGVFGGAMGPAMGMLSVVNNFPDALLQMLCRRDVDSLIADEVVCPAVKEFEPCVRNESCYRLVAGGEAGSTLLGCVHACRARSKQLRDAFMQPGDAQLQPQPGWDDATMRNESASSVREHEPAMQPARSATAADPPPQSGSSWDAVRERHRARREGTAGGSSDDNGFIVDYGPLQAQGEGQARVGRGASADGDQDPSRRITSITPTTRKNAYGDDMME